jgi:carboxylesterase
MSARSFTLDGKSRSAVLLLHGLTGSPVEMHPLARLLNRQGFTVHAPLLAGHGGGSRRILETSWREWVACAEAAYDRLAREHEHVHAGGICLGAMLSVALAARRPVAALAAYGTTFRYDGWTMPRAASNRLLVKLGAGLPLIRSIGFSEREPYGLKDEGIRAFVVRSQRKANGGKLDSFPLGAVRQLYLLADHVDRIARSVVCPALILHARDDDTSSLENARHLQARLGGLARLEILEDSYHMIHLDREVARVAALTGDFLGEVEADVQRHA